MNETTIAIVLIAAVELLALGLAGWVHNNEKGHKRRCKNR